MNDGQPGDHITALRRTLAPLVLGLVLIVPSPSPAQAPETGTQHATSNPQWRVSVVQTTSDLTQRMAVLPSLQFAPILQPGIPVIQVNDQLHYQRISGFGAGMTDTSAWLLYRQLPLGLRVEVMNSLFGSSGLALAFLRLPIGASDFTANGQPYSYDDLPLGQTDPQLLHFSVTHDQSYVIPSLVEALTINPALQIIATPWSAPPWMKANGAYDNTHGIGTLLPADYGALADYLVDFIRAYRNLGIPIAAITPQNEPLAKAPYPSMNFPEPTEAQWLVQNLVPALHAARLHPKIYGYDGGWSAYAITLARSAARGDLTGIAWHCYGGVSLMSYVHLLDPGLDQIMSECSPGVAHFPVPEILIGGVRNWATEVGLWNVALDPAGGPVQPPNVGCMHCTGLVTVDEHTHTVSYTSSYYQLGQLSSFVKRGAQRIGSNHFVKYFHHASGGYGVTRGLDDAAFLNPDGSRVLVAYNNSRGSQRFAVEWNQYSFTYKLPARATVTFVWHP